MNRPFELLCLVNTSIKGHVKKKKKMLSEQGKISSGTSLGQMSKQLYAGAIKQEQGLWFHFAFFQSIRCPFRWIRVTRARGTRLWRLNIIVGVNRTAARRSFTQQFEFITPVESR